MYYKLPSESAEKFCVTRFERSSFTERIITKLLSQKIFSDRLVVPNRRYLNIIFIFYNGIINLSLSFSKKEEQTSFLVLMKSVFSYFYTNGEESKQSFIVLPLS